MTNWQTTGIDALWRIESPKIVAVLARMLGGDVGTAEELAQDALLTALERWPTDGMPDNPGAWLMATAKRRAIDVLRQRSLHARKHVDISRELEEAQAANDLDVEALDDPVGDDLLRLVFVACHPVLSTEAQVALTLRLLGGLTTDEIARAFLVPEPTIAQRIVRAKRTLSERNVPYEVPRGEELGQRVASVLAVIYLVFNEGYSATSGDDWMRPALCEEAMRLGRVLAGLLPQEPEVHGLVALMELQASRLKARTRADGTPILLLDQNRSHWDRLLIGRGLAGLELIRRLGGTGGFYALQAAIAACHAGAVTAEQTDWSRIAALYAQLLEVSPSPVIALNHAVAVSMADGPAAALDLVDGLRGEKVLQAYALLPGVRGDLLDRLGRKAEAREEFERAAQLTRNARERETFERRAAACAG
ncbi:RNA polymerase sigma factor [Lysobacter sp. M2-1]|uniref:RNA polymerase sigma factor n=1 Tax=Lysobacter sp. M2-1 TaxID=2916839 RepID=UPI001F57E64F|nr:RNA polymerase sigma factor [Lysobacter sp. M2-1]